MDCFTVTSLLILIPYSHLVTSMESAGIENEWNHDSTPSNATIYSLNITIPLDQTTYTITRPCVAPRGRPVNPLNAELNPICHLLTLLGAHHIFHVSGLRVNCNLPPGSRTRKFNTGILKNLPLIFGHRCSISLLEPKVT